MFYFVLCYAWNLMLETTLEYAFFYYNSNISLIYADCLLLRVVPLCGSQLSVFEI